MKSSFRFINLYTDPAPNILFPPIRDINILVGQKSLHPGFCEELCKLILENEPEILSSSAPVSVAGLEDGITTRWTKYNLLTWEGSAVSELKKLMKDAYLAYLEATGIERWPNAIQCWGNVLRENENLKLHQHNFEYRPILSATVSLTDSDTETIYKLPMTMKFRGSENRTDRIRIPTEKGNIILVPGWVPHMTTPNKGPSPRITLGIDIGSGYNESEVTVLPFDDGRDLLL